MSAATRHRAVGTVLKLLLPLLLSGTVVAPPPDAHRAAMRAGVSVEVVSEGQNPVYRIEVRNGTDAEVTTTVRQSLPHDVAIRSVSKGGRSVLTGSGTEIAWQLRLPARAEATLQTALESAPHVPLAGPACAFIGEGDMAYDCATAVWGVPDAPPWWHRPQVIIGAVALLVALATVGAWWWWRGRRPRRVAHAAFRRRQPSQSQTGPRAQTKPRSHAAARPRSEVAATARRPAPRRPRNWKVVGSAAFLLFGTVSALLWIGGHQAMSLAPSAQSTTGAWMGTAVTGRLGTPVRDAAFQFTVYRLVCSPDGTDSQRCVANVGLQNVSDTSQPWYAGMQRAYLSSGTWVTGDDAATRAANGNQDIFAHPIPAGGRLLAPLVFTIPGDTTLERIELRSAVFSAGVSITP